MILLLASPACSQAPCTVEFPHDSNPTEIADEDICNFHKIDADAYRGARPRLSAYPKLARLGIRTIVNLEEPKYAERERAALDDLNGKLEPERRIDLISFPIGVTEMSFSGVSDERLQSLFLQIREAPKPIFIHCHMGKDRTGTIVAIYRLAYREKSFNDAFQEALHYKFGIFEIGLRRTIDRYKDTKKVESLSRP